MTIQQKLDIFDENEQELIDSTYTKKELDIELKVSGLESEKRIQTLSENLEKYKSEKEKELNIVKIEKNNLETIIQSLKQELQENQRFKIELEEKEVTGIINVLGQLPTSSDAWPLVQKIKFQLLCKTLKLLLVWRL